MPINVKKIDELTVLWIGTLRKNGEGYLRMEGRSMEPTLNIGERFLVKESKPQTIRNNEIVAFTANEEIIVHRIVDKFRFLDKLYFVHRGDNAGLLGTGIFGEDQLLGKLEVRGCRQIEKEDADGRRFISGNQRGLKKSAVISEYLLRKFFIYFFIFKQLFKKILRIQTDRSTDSRG